MRRSIKSFLNGRYGTGIAKGLAIALTLAGASWAADGQAGQAAAYLKMGIGARALGMGGAFVGVADDSTAAFWNPAGLAQLEKREITTMHTSLTFDRKYNFINYAAPFKRTGGTVAFSYIRFGVDDINETHVWRWANSAKTIATRDAVYGDPIRLPDATDGNREKSLPVMVGDDGLKSVLEAGTYGSYGQWRNAYGNNDVEIFGNFQDLETAFIMSYAQKFKNNDAWMFGGNIKYLTQRLYSTNASSFGLDLGALYRVNERIRLGLSLRDIGASLKWDTPSGRKDEVPITTTFGVAYNPRHNMLMSLDLNKVKDLDLKYKFGVEAWFKEKIALRAGSDDKSFTAGTSFKIPQWEFDYAFKNQELGDEHRLSATRRF